MVSAEDIVIGIGIFIIVGMIAGIIIYYVISRANMTPAEEAAAKKRSAKLRERELDLLLLNQMIR